MRYTIFIFSLLYVCMVVSRVAAASDTFGYQLESCNNGLAAKSPIENYIGQSLSVVVNAEGIEGLVPAHGVPFVLTSSTESQIETSDSKLIYKSQKVEDNQFQLMLKEVGKSVDRDFVRQAESHKVNINITEESLVVEWTELDEEWDNFFVCTYKSVVSTAKN